MRLGWTVRFFMIVGLLVYCVVCRTRGRCLLKFRLEHSRWLGPGLELTEPLSVGCCLKQENWLEVRIHSVKEKEESLSQETRNPPGAIEIILVRVHWSYCQGLLTVWPWAHWTLNNWIIDSALDLSWLHPCALGCSCIPANLDLKFHHLECICKGTKLKVLKIRNSRKIYVRMIGEVCLMNVKKNQENRSIGRGNIKRESRQSRFPGNFEVFGPFNWTVVTNRKNELSSSTLHFSQKRAQHD